MLSLGNVAAPTVMRAPTGPASTERKNSKAKTIRLDFELFPTDSTRYPEFNYAKLLQLERKKLKLMKQKPSVDAFDPFVENDSDVARIAKELEKKYGTAYASGRGRSRKDDHCDIGMGYDESDSFIDNTDAYDEIIPEEVETVEGGFYINCGALEFKQLIPKSGTTKTDEIIKMPNKVRKRKLSSSSEESSEEEEEDATNAVNGGEKQQNAIDGQPKVVLPKKPKKNPISSASNSPKPSANEIGSDSDKERVRQKPMKTTTVKDMLKAKRDNFLKKRSDGESNGSAKGSNGELKSSGKESSDSDDSTDDSDSQQSDEPAQAAPKSEGNMQKLRVNDTKLPVLEPEFAASIHQFRDAVKSKNMTGNRFTFDDKLTADFLKIDDHLLCLEKTQRNMVFAHLEYQLMLPKHLLVRKAKQLRFKEEKLKSKRALDKLKQAIYEIMPRVIKDYEESLRKFAEMQADNVNSEHPPKMPKKKFPWNSKLRNLLFDVYETRWTSFPVVGSRKQTLVEFVKQYLKEKVAELWPNGWMSSDELRKEIEKHQKMAKKAVERQKAKQAAASSDASVANPASAAPASSTASALTSKQLEELAALSNRAAANSDTDSVASSNATSSSKGMKPSTSKLKSNKVGEHAASNDTPAPTVTASVKQKPQAPPTAHVINLDKYKTANDILLTSQQLVGAIVKAELQARPSQGKPNKILSTRCDSSSESDVVEIFNAELNSNKQKYRKNPAAASHHNMMPSSTQNVQGFEINYWDASTPVSSSATYMQNQYASSSRTSSTNVINLDSDSDHADATSHAPQKYKKDQ